METKKMKRVLLFSSGMDSLIIKELLQIKDSECLFVDMGTDENKVERILIEKKYPDVRIYTLPLQPLSLSNYIIPYRNNILTLIAANCGNNIIFGFTLGDTTKDKDYVFKAQMEAVLNYFALDKDKVSIPGPFAINMPFKMCTKTELVSEYLKRGFNIDNLFSSSSCYAGSEKPCGRCRSCLRKYVAFENNDIKKSEYWETEPTKDMLLSFLKESIYKKRNYKEIEEIKRCIRKKQF